MDDRFDDAAGERPRCFGDTSRLHIARSAALSDVYINVNDGDVWIGEYAMFAHGVMLLTGAHDYTKRGKERMTSGAHLPDWPWPMGRDIVIEQGAWIGSRAVIVGPVRIGADAVVCAGSVVVKDVAAGAMVAGNPARVIKQIWARSVEHDTPGRNYSLGN